jgi:hypothetical protein
MSNGILARIGFRDVRVCGVGDGDVEIDELGENCLGVHDSIGRFVSSYTGDVGGNPTH